ncbi:MAG TPA: hypothetical protein VHO06_08050 [Polyangia bacterium]|nr:hypothetical protein [Polyangia bacterium]
MKLILAAILAGSFFVSYPVKADDNPAGDSAKSSKKKKKSDKKDDKGDKGADEGAKPSGGGW